jgi:WD40 repeat protein/energy-coupling factor transporter ATP-binding protein EcfA2
MAEATSGYAVLRTRPVRKQQVAKYDVFLSYSRSDEGAARVVDSSLRSHGLKTFFDRRELSPGLRWIVALEEAIARSASAAILVGRAGIGNTQQYERELALVRQSQDRDFPVIPVLLPGCQEAPAGFLQLVTWIDLRGETEVQSEAVALRSLVAAISGKTSDSAEVKASICPYMGLESFREEDAAFFCGRDAATRELVAKVGKHSFVAVVGRSGSGKSSLVYAGLVPALRRQRATRLWDVVALRPGASPLRSLAACFGQAPAGAGPAATDRFFEGEVAAMREGDTSILARVIVDRLDLAAERPDCLLIYVDQWEELYAMAPDAEQPEARTRHALDTDRFIALLLTAASGMQGRVHVVIAVRADFYGRMITHPDVSAMLPRQQVNLGPMSRDELSAAIEMPAEQMGLRFAPPDLVDQILDDVGADEGMLPLLQYALKETWRRRQGELLTADGYASAGRVQGAIQKTAERTYDSLTDTEKEAARRLFLRLVTPGEGQEDTRARSTIPDDPVLRRIVNKFADRRARLLITGSEALPVHVSSAPTLRDAASDVVRSATDGVRPTVEVAHEALIRTWPTLRSWLDASRDKLRARSAILQQKREWEFNGQREDLLLQRGFQLERGRALLADPGDVAIDDLQPYIMASIRDEKQRVDRENELAVAEQRRIAEANRREREAAERAQNEAEARARAEEVARIGAEQARNAGEAARVRLKHWLYAFMSTAIIALLGLAIALWQGVVADSNLRWAFLVRAEQLLTDSKPTSALALANATGISTYTAYAFRWMASSRRDVDARIRLGSIAQIVGDASTVPVNSWKAPSPVTAVAIDLAGRSVAIGDSTGSVFLLSTTVGAVARALQGHSRSRIIAIGFIERSSRLMSATASEIRLWDTASGHSLQICRDKGEITDAAVDPTGRFLASTASDGTVAIWDVRTAEPTKILTVKDHHGSALALGFSADGGRLATAGNDGYVVVRNTEHQDLVKQILTQRTDLSGIALNGKGDYLATASLSGPVEIWGIGKVEDDARPRSLPVPLDKRWRIKFSPDGKWLALGSWRGTVGFWDPETLNYKGTIDGHDHRINDMAFAMGNSLFVTASESGMSHLWSLESLAPTFYDMKVGDGENIVGRYNSDGSQFLAGNSEGVVKLFDVDPVGKFHEKCLIKLKNWVVNGVFLEDLRKVALLELWENGVADHDVLTIWSSENCAADHSFSDPDRTFKEGLAYDVSTHSLAWGDHAGRVSLFDMSRGRRPEVLPDVHTDSINEMVFAPGGRLLITAGADGKVLEWDLASRKVVHQMRGLSGSVNTIKLSPDGKTMAAGGDGDRIYIWDIGNEVPKTVLEFPGNTNRLAFSGDGSTIGAGSDARYIAIWSTNSWQKIFQLNVLVGVRSVYGFRASSGDLAFDGENGTVRVIPGSRLKVRERRHAPAVLDGLEIFFDGGAPTLVPSGNNQTARTGSEVCALEPMQLRSRAP